MYNNILSKVTSRIDRTESIMYDSLSFFDLSEGTQTDLPPI